MPNWNTSLGSTAKAMKIGLVGPCSPSDLADLFSSADNKRARQHVGYRGIPVSSLARALISHGHHVVVVSTSMKASMATDTFSGKNIEMIVVPQRISPRKLALTLFSKEVFLMKRVLKEINVDVINAHWTYEFALSALLSGKPTIVTVHDSPFTIFRFLPDPYRFFRLIMAFMVRLMSRRYIFVSEYLHQKWSRHFLLLKRQAIIPNLPPYPALRVRKIRRTVTKVVSIGDSGARKNIKKLIVSWSRIRSANEVLELHLVGYGLDVNGELYQWAQVRNLNYGIVWHGYLERNQVKALLSGGDILIHPSLEESFGLTLLEAMSQRIPIIAGLKSGGVPSVTGDAAVLVDMKDANAIEHALLKLISNFDLRNNLVEKGVNRLNTLFSTDVIVNRIISEYQTVIKYE